MGRKSKVEWADWDPVKKKYRTNRVMKVELDFPGSGRWLKVREGYEFDLSVPWWLLWAQSRHDRVLLRMALFHDFLLEDPRFDRAVAAAQGRLIARQDASAQKAWRAGISMMIATAFK